MNKTCAGCGERWEVMHVAETLEMYEGQAQRVRPDASQRAVKDMEGDFWRLWFLNSEHIANGEFQIEMCPACEPRIGVEGCKDCGGTGRVLAWKLREDTTSIDWKYGTGRFIKWAPKPFRTIRAVVCADGLQYRGIAHCPSCYNCRSEYLEQMRRHGWDEAALQEEARPRILEAYKR